MSFGMTISCQESALPERIYTVRVGKRGLPFANQIHLGGP